MPDELAGPLGLGGAIPLGPGTPARSPQPEALSPPQPTEVPDHVIEPSEVLQLAPEPVDPDRQLPTGFAKLSVQRAYADGREAFWLIGHSGTQTMQLDSASARLRPDDLALHNLRRGRPIPPSEVLLGLARWSRTQEDLVAWINDLRAQHGAELQLVVWDDTDYDIPWELLLLPDRRDRGLIAGILGALVTVVRWTTIRRAGTAPFGEPASCAGHVLGYYADRMRRDREVFENYVHQPHVGTPRTFLTDLSRRNLGAGLVYMGCHAEYGAHAHEVRIDALTWNRLDLHPMSALEGGSTLVCLNACDSARSFRNLGQGEDVLRGFAELFLRKGAGGCIAVSGKVGDDIAHLLVRDLVGRVCADPELPVAGALREFRAAAAVRLPDPESWVDRLGGDTENEREVLLVLYSFMFLYFGHPRTTLQLKVRAREEGA
ncbi:CHAT domain-containing protein [Streptomyces sp. NPDC001714]|uniref:CHAT domain-containing protein n=1 Tax=Streptomyces sp. NPDC001714 TaxID=3364603 RepID=UPI0036866B6A